MEINKIELIKLVPTQNNHLKNKTSGDMYESVVYLGIYDNAENYEEVTEKEYLEWKEQKEETNNK